MDKNNTLKHLDINLNFHGTQVKELLISHKNTQKNGCPLGHIWCWQFFWDFTNYIKITMKKGLKECNATSDKKASRPKLLQ